MPGLHKSCREAARSWKLFTLYPLSVFLCKIVRIPSPPRTTKPHTVRLRRLHLCDALGGRHRRSPRKPGPGGRPTGCWGEEPTPGGSALGCLGHRRGLGCGGFMWNSPGPARESGGEPGLFSRPSRPLALPFPSRRGGKPLRAVPAIAKTPKL